MRNLTKPAAFLAIALAACATSAGAQHYGSRGNLEASATDAERAESKPSTSGSFPASTGRALN